MAEPKMFMTSAAREAAAERNGPRRTVFGIKANAKYHEVRIDSI
jgi:hypothetical protein